MRRMAASVLVFEAFIALFFGLVAAKLHPSGDWIVAVVLGGVCILLSGMMRYRWAYGVGWALQIGFIAAGFLVTDMFVLGVIFTAIWWAGLHFGQKAEQIKAQRMAEQEAGSDEQAAEADAEAPTPTPTSTERPGVKAR
jgi:Sec-independent protein secretion pathway component TatC